MRCAFELRCVQWHDEVTQVEVSLLKTFMMVFGGRGGLTQQLLPWAGAHVNLRCSCCILRVQGLPCTDCAKPRRGALPQRPKMSHQRAKPRRNHGLKCQCQNRQQATKSSWQGAIIAYAAARSAHPKSPPASTAAVLDPWRAAPAVLQRYNESHFHDRL